MTGREATGALFSALPIEFREWLVRLSNDLDETGYRIGEYYPYAATMLKTYGRQVDEWLEELGRDTLVPKMPCFCGTKDAYRCPTHINPVQSTSGGR